MNAEIRGLTKSNIHQIRQKNECTKCGRIYPFKKGLTFCPACGFYLKTITKQVTNPPKGKYDYHFLKYGVEDDPENEYQIDEE
jgi:rRNA maturation endonuclease Nob1